MDVQDYVRDDLNWWMSKIMCTVDVQDYVQLMDVQDYAQNYGDARRLAAARKPEPGLPGFSPLGRWKRLQQHGLKLRFIAESQYGSVQ